MPSPAPAELMAAKETEVSSGSPSRGGRGWSSALWEADGGGRGKRSSVGAGWGGIGLCRKRGHKISAEQSSFYPEERELE